MATLLSESQLEEILESQLEELLDEMPASAREREESTFDDTVPSPGEIVLFGAGNLGRKALLALRSAHLEPLAFSDNAPALWGTEIEGVRVLSPVAAAAQFGRTATFLVTTMDHDAVRRQLLESGCARIASFLSLFWRFPAAFLPFFCLETPRQTLSHAARLRKAFGLWADITSRQEFLSQIAWRLLGDFDLLSPPVAGDQYFPEDLLALVPHEVFVDCGAFDGDTIRAILKRRTDFRCLVAIEPDPVNFGRLRQYLSELPDSLQEKVSPRKAGVGVTTGKVRFEVTGTDHSKVSEQGGLEVECIALTDLLEEHRPTFVKMDVEGAELPALLAARQAMRRSSAIWAVSVYHRPEDLWQIPLLMHSCLNGHRFFLRRHSPAFYDLVCYAIPAERCLREAPVRALESDLLERLARRRAAISEIPRVRPSSRMRRKPKPR